jgi:hypothetical protein
MMSSNQEQEMPLPMDIPMD